MSHGINLCNKIRLRLDLIRIKFKHFQIIIFVLMLMFNVLIFSVTFV